MANKVNKIYDCAIIGAGPAGMAAAVYLARADKSVCIIDKDGFGGNIAMSPLVENIPGFSSISGIDFATNMYEQMTKYPNVEHVINEVVFVSYKRGLFVLSLADRSTICSTSIIIATGTKHKELKLDTKDVYYCASCDGAFFKNKSVVVAGAGNTGATYAIELASYCKHVYICDVTFDMCCENALKNKISNIENIQWLPNCKIVSVKNDKNGKLTTVNLSSGATIKASGIFAAIGMEPKAEIFKQFVDLNVKGFINTNETMAGTVPGVFVAGDCRTKDVRQVATAVSDGAIAAVNAIKFLNMQ